MTVRVASAAAAQTQAAHLASASVPAAGGVSVEVTNVAPPGSALYWTKRGDTVSSVAHHYLSQTSYLTSSELAEALRKTNEHIPGTFLKPGQTIIVPGILEAPIVEKTIPVPRDFEVRSVYLTGLMAGSDHGLRIIRRWRELGGNAVVFTLLKAAFLDPLSYRDAARLVTVIENDGWVPTVSEFQEIRSHTRTLEQLALAEYRDMQLSGTGEPTRVYAARVTASFFPLLGVNAAQGRTFLPEENQPDRPPVVILSSGFWRTRLGSDPGIIGRTLRLDGQPAEVVGVLPPTFHFDYPTLGADEPVDLYAAYPIERSLSFERAANGQGVPVRVLARRREGVALAQVQSDLWDTALVLARENRSPFPGHPHDPVMFGFNAIPLRDAIIGDQRSLLWLLVGGVAVLLLIGCANAAQLLLARSLRRAREIAVRSALGASRGRLMRQFLLEGLVLAVCGGSIGLLVAGWMARLFSSVLPERSPLLAASHLDLVVVVFTFAISVFSAAVFATLPAIKGSRWTPGPSLSARIATGSPGRCSVDARRGSISARRRSA
jgi:predicted permease